MKEDFSSQHRLSARFQNLYFGVCFKFCFSFYGIIVYCVVNRFTSALPLPLWYMYWWVFNSCQSVPPILWINCSLKLTHFAPIEESLFYSLWCCYGSATMDFECDSVALSKYMKKIWCLVLWSATYKSKKMIWHITSQIIAKDICQLGQAQNNFGK